MPDVGELHRLAIQAHQVGNFQHAAHLLESALQIAPGQADLWVDLGPIYRRLGRAADAEKCYRHALELMPGHADALHNLGNVLRDAARFDEAEKYYRAAISARPRFAEACHNLGSLLNELGRPQEAVAFCRQAVALKPDNAEAFNDLGNALLDIGLLSEAEQAYREVIRLRPGNAPAHGNLAKAFMLLGRMPEAVATARRALELKPDFARAHSNLIFMLDLLEGSAMAAQQEERRRWYAAHGQRHARTIGPHHNEPDPERKLRLGYVSADFRQHSACSVFAPVICSHDRSAYEVVCYSGVTQEDQHTRRLREAANGWRSTVRQTDEAVADQIRRDRIDILVDLSGHSAGNRLGVFVLKPAPVQVTAWGYATGTGLKTIDYFLADPVVVEPGERALFAEEIVDLPCAFCYEAPPYIAEVGPLPCAEGLPFTYGCVNRLEKVSDGIVRLWGRIFEAAPNARLLIKDRALDDPGFRHSLLARLKQLGGIASERVELLGRSLHAEHLKIFNRVDVGLDPFPHGGGVSTAEALCMGVPVVTLRGDTITSRLTASVLYELGLRDWVANTDDEYVEIAVRAARSTAALGRLRQGLRSRVRTSRFGDARQYTSAVEQAYRAMWRRWCATRNNAG